MQIALSPGSLLRAQTAGELDSLQFGPGFLFKDGIYTHIDMVRANCPISPARVITHLDRFNHDFYKTVLSQEKLYLYDDQGVKVFINCKDIWGYAYHGTMYIQIGSRFHRLLLEGILSRFISITTTYEKVYRRYGEPFGYESATNDVNAYKVPSYKEVTRNRGIYLLDFAENSMKGYEPESLMRVLERDPELYQEYASLGSRQQKKKMQEFIRRYNSRHPLYLPAACNE